MSEKGGRAQVEVVVPVYNGLRTLPACVDAVLRQTVAPGKVWVVDNGSTDGTYEWLVERARGEPRLRVLREARRGQAAARNAALQFVEAPVVAFTDADCVPEPTWLERLLEAYEDSGVAAAAGAVKGHEATSVVERYQSVAAFPTPREGAVVDRYDFPSVVFYTANLSVRTEVLRLLGGFDERIVPSDDTDLCSRILQAGWKIAYTAAARVGHRHRARIGVMLKRLYEYGTSRPRLLRKHSPRTCYVLVLGHQIVWRGAVTAHVNLTSPEKVCLGLAMLSAWEPWIAAGLVAYWAWLAAQLGRTARARGLEPRSWWELAVWTGLHVAEFFATNLGGLRGGVGNRVIWL